MPSFTHAHCSPHRRAGADEEVPSQTPTPSKTAPIAASKKNHELQLFAVFSERHKFILHKCQIYELSMHNAAMSII